MEVGVTFMLAARLEAGAADTGRSRSWLEAGRAFQVAPNR
jgi:hypothetical protein